MITRTEDFSTGSSNAGITLSDLRLQIVDTSGANVGSAQQNGVDDCIIVEFGIGVYQVTFSLDELDQGSAKLYKQSNSAFLGSISINPESGVIVASAAIRTGVNYTVQRGDTWRIFFENIGNIVGIDNLWFTMKNTYNEEDENSVLQIDLSTGLLRLNYDSPDNSLDGSIEVVNSSFGNLYVNLAPDSSRQIEPMDYQYDIQTLDEGVIRTAAVGEIFVTGDVTRSI